MSEQKLNRREFFERAAMLGAVAAGAGSFLAACQKQGGNGAEAEGGAGAQKAEGGGAKGGELSCTDTAGLSEQQIKVRESLNYVDKSPKPEQLCENCQLYKEAPSAGECGGCQTVPGPIHPKGWCTAWVKKS
jgi:hypothetical protein